MGTAVGTEGLSDPVSGLQQLYQDKEMTEMTVVLVKRRCRSRRRQGQQSRHRVSEWRDQHDELTPHPVLPLPYSSQRKTKVKTRNKVFPVCLGRQRTEPPGPLTFLTWITVIAGGAGKVQPRHSGRWEKKQTDQCCLIDTLLCKLFKGLLQHIGKRHQRLECNPEQTLLLPACWDNHTTQIAWH